MNTLNKPESSQLAEILAAESDLEMKIDIISLEKNNKASLNFRSAVGRVIQSTLKESNKGIRNVNFSNLKYLTYIYVPALLSCIEAHMLEKMAQPQHNASMIGLKVNIKL